MPKLIAVIESDQKRGSGSAEDPVRRVTRYHSPDGELLAEVDPWVIETARAMVGPGLCVPVGSDLQVTVPGRFLAAVIGGR